jgi:hypothetical protein
MKIKHQIKLDRLIGKVDNDFNISESDWIPRVAAWTIDALSQMKLLPMERKKRILDVKERIAIFPCTLNAKEIKVYDSNGCEIRELNSSTCNCNSGLNSNTTNSSEIAVFRPDGNNPVNFMKVGGIINPDANRNFVIAGNNIELNFDADSIVVESYETATYYDEYYDCEVPYIYENGILLEALAWFILFKYLSRGSKHQVYDLKSSSPVTNPFLQWNNLKSKAIASVKNEIYTADGWRNFFYNSTFDPRR